MNDLEIQQRLSDLDAAVSKDGARLLIYYDEEGTYCELIANRKGFLRAGIEMLRAAIAPLGPNEFITPIDLNYLTGDKGLLVKRLIRQEDVAAAIPEPRERTWKSKAAAAGCLMLFVLLAVCAFIGIGQVFIWILGK